MQQTSVCPRDANSTAQSEGEGEGEGERTIDRRQPSRRGVPFTSVTKNVTLLEVVLPMSGATSGMSSGTLRTGLMVSMMFTLKSYVACCEHQRRTRDSAGSGLSAALQPAGMYMRACLLTVPKMGSCAVQLTGVSAYENGCPGAGMQLTAADSPFLSVAVGGVKLTTVVIPSACLVSVSPAAAPPDAGAVNVGATLGVMTVTVNCSRAVLAVPAGGVSLAVHVTLVSPSLNSVFGAGRHSTVAPNRSVAVGGVYVTLATATL